MSEQEKERAALLNNLIELSKSPFICATFSRTGRADFPEFLFEQLDRFTIAVGREMKIISDMNDSAQDK